MGVLLGGLTLRDDRGRVETMARIAPLHGLDRTGLGEKGWAEVPDDLIGGHPELDAPARAGPDGALNGPQPEMDPVTGAVKPGGAAR